MSDEQTERLIANCMKIAGPSPTVESIRDALEMAIELAVNNERVRIEGDMKRLLWHEDESSRQPLWNQPDRLHGAC